MVIGRGAFGVVYRGKLKDIDVAVKTLPAADNATWRMFEKELKVWGGLSQQNGEPTLRMSENQGNVAARTY